MTQLISFSDARKILGISDHKTAKDFLSDVKPVYMGRNTTVYEADAIRKLVPAAQARKEQMRAKMQHIAANARAVLAAQRANGTARPAGRPSIESRLIAIEAKLDRLLANGHAK